MKKLVTSSLLACVVLISTCCTVHVYANSKCWPVDVEKEQCVELECVDTRTPLF